MSQITSYHAHVYFDGDSVESARQLCETVRDRFGADMGRVHEKAVGPHPEWSCQLEFAADKFADIVPWLAINRAGLTVFLHPNSGDPYADHTDHAIWMGSMPDLRLDVLRAHIEAEHS